ncbi:MAG: FAD:protein FMN transferase [Gemmataceae bacterium]|nr:FAD:protein FMN transferase [Gemmataceae bacterium]
MLPILIVFLADAGPARFRFAEPHMGTTFAVTLYAADEAAAKKAARAAFARVAELNGIMSDYLPASELMKLCDKAGGEPVKVSGELFAVLARARKVSEETDGAFDVTVGPVVRLWRVARKTARLPDKDRLAAARALVGWRMMALDPRTRTVRLEKKGMRLDLGGIAKGYAADEMLAVLKRHGIERALVAAGGDLRMGSPPPGKKGWTVDIAPIDRKEKSRRLELADCAVSTSGDAEQFVEVDGVRYSHLVDPRTGLGLVGRMSATVIARDGITADSLTKAVAILGAKKGFAVLARYKGASGRLVTRTDDGVKVEVSEGFPK